MESKILGYRHVISHLVYVFQWISSRWIVDESYRHFLACLCSNSSFLVEYRARLCWNSPPSEPRVLNRSAIIQVGYPILKIIQKLLNFISIDTNILESIKRIDTWINIEDEGRAVLLLSWYFWQHRSSILNSFPSFLSKWGNDFFD